MKYVKLFENFEDFDPYELMMITPQKKAQMIIDALRSGNTNKNLVETLIAMGADINWQDEDGWTALNYAISFDNVNICKMLIEAGADPNSRDIDNKTPVHYAARTWKGNSEILLLLLDAGGEVNVRDRDWGWTPLMYALHQNNISIFEHLLKAGADPNIQSHNGNTSLHWAISFHYKSPKIIQELLDAGADPSIRNDLGDTSFDAAEQSNVEELVEILKRYKKKIN